MLCYFLHRRSKRSDKLDLPQELRGGLLKDLGAVGAR